MIPKTQKLNQGFSILEVLFSIIILAIALLATARLHAMVTQDGGYAKARGIAANLIQEKFDDIKTFSVLYDNPDTASVNECAAPTYCYSELTGNAGGKEKSSGALEVASGNVTVGNTTYNRTWTVVDYYNCTVASAASTSNCAAPNAKPYPDFKLVTILVSWTDERGVTQPISMQTVISASDPATQARMVGLSSGGGPVVSYTPIGVPDAVPVPINTGGTNFKESSKPEPDVISNGTAAEVSFDSVSYVDDGAGGYNTTEREEFTTVSCECSFNGTGTAYTPSRMIWNGSSLKAKIGAQVTKPVGTPESGQSDLCTACCKDHHDIGGFSGTAYAKYDPDRPVSEYASNGDHKHYWYSNCVAGTLGQTSGCNASDKNPANGYGEVDSGAYLESCRFKRVDGIWRLWQDWRQVKMTVIPYDFLPVAANLNAYVDMVEAVIENTVRSDSGISATPLSTALAGRDYTLTNSTSPQLLGRALYVDRVYKEAAPTTIDSDYYTGLIAKLQGSGDWLNIVPFYEANLTLLSDWSSASPAIATVTSEAIKDVTNMTSGYYNTFSRGYVKGISGGNAVITAKARIGNSGVTGGVNTSSPSYGISAYDNGKLLTDSITVTIPGSTTTVTTYNVSGKFISRNSDTDLSKITFSSSGAICTLGAISSNARIYTCPSVPNNSIVSLTFTTADTSGGFDTGSPKTFTVTSATGPDIGVFGKTLKIEGQSMTNKKLTSISASNGLSCSLENGGNAYSCTKNRGSGYSGTITFVSSGNTVTPSSYTFTNQNEDITNGYDIAIN